MDSRSVIMKMCALLALLLPAVALADYRIPDANARLRDVQQLRERLDSINVPASIQALPRSAAQPLPAPKPPTTFAQPPAPPAALGQPAGPGHK
jgi:hypothetical protein